MALNSDTLRASPGTIEQVEKATLRMVTQAIYDFREDAIEIFAGESDLVADIGEDITREALDRQGMPTIPVRLFGKIDYKRATYLFHPDYAVRQALFVDSKAEKKPKARALLLYKPPKPQCESDRSGNGSRLMYREMWTASQWCAGTNTIMACISPGCTGIAVVRGDEYLTTTIFVKYNYSENMDAASPNRLDSISVLCLPNGLLQDRYNPTADDSIRLAGRNAPTRGEAFRVRISLDALKGKANWRVQSIAADPAQPFAWDG